MKKLIVFSLMLLAGILMVTAAVAQKTPTIKIGINAEITGDIPKVGEATKFAAQMWVEDVNKAGGIEVGGKKYKVELAIEDNEAKAESAAKAAPN
jgi:branched-chain amino acid transport system substrate-binding protein